MLSGSALMVARTAPLAGLSAASALFNANSAARTCVLVISAVPRAWCCRRSSKALTSIATDWRRLRGRLPRGFRGGRAGCRLRFAARERVTAAPAVSPASCATGRQRTPPRSRYAGRARRRGGRRNRPSTDLVSGPSNVLVMVSALFEGEPTGARTSGLSAGLSAEARRAKAEARQRGSDVGDEAAIC